VGGFAWATAVGGKVIEKRFLGIVEAGVVEKYKSERGVYLENFWDYLLPNYPLGAGLGRWGSTYQYFGREERSPLIFVHIAIAGWLLDGGVLMIVLYGGAVCAAFIASYRLATTCRHQNIQYMAAVVCGLNVLYIGASFSGPLFDCQLGLYFWLLNSALHGAAVWARGQPGAARPAGGGRRTPGWAATGG
jgi:hypothetical protein